MYDPALMDHAEEYFSLTKKKYENLMFNVANGEALSNIAGECDPIRDIKMDTEIFGGIKREAERSAAALVALMTEILEDPRSFVYLQATLGSSELARIFDEALKQFGKVCESNGETLLEEQVGCA